jgi:uncharacterized protein (TIGR03086 family)
MGDDRASALSLLPVAAEEFGRRVHAVPPDRWDAPTPDAEWTVRDLVNHLVGEHLWAPELLAGHTIDEVGDRFSGDVLGDDPLAAWDAAIYRSLSAWGQTPPDRLVHLSFGDVPAREYAEQMLVDLVVHGWDLARGAGLDERLDPATVRHALAYSEKHADELAGSGLFAEPVQVDSDDPQDRLLGLLGRHP